MDATRRHGADSKADFFATFHTLCSRLLSPLERQVLQRALQDYRTTGQVADLVASTQALWLSPAKLQLLPFVRQVVSQEDRPYFDTLLGIHEGYVVKGPGPGSLASLTSNNKAPSSMASSTLSGNHPMGRRGGVHVIKVGSSASPRMGFSVRGGSEYGLGIFVSNVDPDSPAGAASLA